MPKAKADPATGASGHDAQLAADVKAQLAQLGLGSGGAFNDAGFDDFAPEKANKRIDKKRPAGRQLQGGSRGHAAAADGKQQQHLHGGRQQQQHSAHQQEQQVGRQKQQNGRHQQLGRGGRDQQRQVGHSQQRRSWQQQGENTEEAAPIPKVPNAKSILPKDEPAIWHEAASAMPPLPSAKAEAAPEVVLQLRKQAERLLLVEEQAFEQNMVRRGGVDTKWLQQVRRGGTTADRVAAMSVLVQDGAVANLPSLDSLLAMCAKKGGARAVVGSAMDALKELFTSVLLPDRKLRFFEQQPLDKAEAGKDGERRLLYWLLEDGIKKRYAQFVEVLEGCSRDSLEFVKDRAVKTLLELLSSKPEQEVRLLSALVNKLGDPNRKLASKVGYLLTCLLAEHPGMNVVVVREIERLMFRPGLQERARYYCVVYLNQMMLSHRQQQQGLQGQGSLARRLIDVYFTVFRMILDGKIGTAAQLAKQQQDKVAAEAASRKRGEAAKAKAAGAARLAAEAAASSDHSGEMDGRMLAALITGMRRAFPYVPAEEVEPLIEAHADALFRLVHARSFGVATQALLLLFQLMSSRSTVSDRFYRALYAALGSPELYRSTKAPMFLSMLFKALKADVSARRSAAFAKRLLQVAQESPPHFACGCLLMISELLKARPALWGAVLQAEEGDGDGLEHFHDAPDEQEEKCTPAAVADADVGKQRRQKGAGAGGDAGHTGNDSEDAEEATEEEDSEEEELAAGTSEEEEAAVDVEDGSDLELMPGAQQQVAAVAAVQRQRKRAQQAAAAPRWPASADAYDMHKREPLFCNADRSCLWELTSLAAHVHPSVAAMARTLLAGQSVVYSGDPLRDLTLAAFLEKFVQKKAKASTKGDSAMQPLAAQQAGVHTQALAALADKDVRPDDMFFHKYYDLQAVRDKAAKKKKKKGSEDELLSDAESDDSDAADEFLAGEEEGGDGGIGADPDRSGMDYDYAGLAAAMESDSAGDDDDEEGEEGEEESDSGSEPGSGNGSEEEEGLEPAGSTFSDTSVSEGFTGEGGSELSSSSEEAGLSGPEVGDLSGGEFEAQLVAADLLDNEADSGSSSDEDGNDAVADAEVAALIQRHGIKAVLATASDDEEEALNPFELAEASSSEEEQEEQEQQRRRPGKKGKGAAVAAADVGGKQKKKKSNGDPMGIFASADDYEDMIEQDLADAEGLDDGQDKEEDSSRGGGGRGSGGKRQCGGAGGGGGMPPKRQQQGRGGGWGSKRPRR